MPFWEQTAKRRSLVQRIGATLLWVLSLQVAAAAPAEDAEVDANATHPGETTPDASEDEARLFTTPEEKREAGRRTEITPWLTAYGLVEVEFSYEDYDIDHGRDDDSGRYDVTTVQLGLVVDLFELAEVEAIVEYDSNEGSTKFEEAFVAIEKDRWALSAGRLYTPFGIYFSRFVSGPLIEFGETRANEALIVSHSPDDALDLSVTLYSGDARKSGTSAPQWNWVLAMDAEISPEWSVGWSYQTDLADADSELLEDEGNRYDRRVAGISAYVQWAQEPYQAGLEVLGATSSFDELDADRDRPSAWNAEVSRSFLDEDFEVALRIEGSDELEDEPHLRYGIAANWRISEYAVLTLEYLHGEFKDELATNDDDEPYDHVDSVAAELTLEF